VSDIKLEFPVQSSPLRNDGYTVIGGQRDTILSSLKEIWRYRSLIFELVRRDLKMRYKGRVGGILWSLFPPLLQVLTITLMVKFFLTQVSNYSAYLMAVMFLWQFFMNTVLDSSQSLLANSQLVRKIYFPRAILPIVTLTSNMIHFFISFVFTLLYFFVVPVSDPIYPQNLRWEILWALPCVLCVGMLALGIGYLLSYITTFYEDIRFLSGTFLGLCLYAVPILYPIEKVFAQPNIFPIYMMNPMAALLVGFQRALLPPIIDEKAVVEIRPLPFHDLLPWVIVAFITSSLILALGFWMFERSKWSIMERL
jgi:ABC-type polysaccharide/polyol phosphate export permease